MSNPDFKLREIGSPPVLHNRLAAILDRPASTAAGPRVALAGKLTAADAPGGGEIQLWALTRALPSVGVRARAWRPWEDRWSDLDLLHLVGSLPEHQAVVDAAHRHRIPVALSPVAWFSYAQYWNEPHSMVRRLAACARHGLRTLCPRHPSWRRRLYHSADLLLPNSQAEAEQLMRLFQVPADRIRIVPNGAESRLALADPQHFFERYGLRNFVLYAGRIEPRKNQLGFLQATRHLRLPTLILGDVVPGHEAYALACRQAAGPEVRFLPALAHDDPLLASAYAACGCLVLWSWFETPGLVALEAAMSGTPLVLPQEGAASEYFGEHAQYVAAGDAKGLCKAVLAALLMARSPARAQLVQQFFSWDAVAGLTRDAYETVLRHPCR